MTKLDPLELAVMQKLLDGEHPVLAALRRQFEVASVASRELTGAGFFTHFVIPAETVSAPLQGGKLQFGDVEATIVGLQHGAGFLLYIQDGVIQMLEGYSYEEPWPSNIEGFRLFYSDPTRKTIIHILK